MKINVLFILTAFCNYVENAKVLVVAPVPNYSHFIGPFRLAQELAGKNHQVTIISPYPQRIPIKNYREVPIIENLQFVEDEKKKFISFNQKKISENLFSLFEMSLRLTEYTLVNPNVRKLMNSDEHFDVIIVEHFLNDAVIGLGHYFKAPVILLSSEIPNVMNNYIFANPAPISYVPIKGGLLTQRMNFWERLQNLFLNGIFHLLMELYYLPNQQELFKKYIDPKTDFNDILHNTSLMLTNSHISVSNAIPLVPSIKEVGGYHINPYPKLPDDLQNYLDSAKNGVILFTIGSTLQSKDLKSWMIEAFLKAFSKIKQKVLWKFEEDLPELPPNVKIMKWLPQQDVLAHPNVRLFITHGGFLSCLETVYYAVPIIGIPVFGDQKYNIAGAVSNGYAVSIALNELTEEKLSWALNEILNNPVYRENAQRRSRLMHDQPLKPIDAAVYWVEHVIRHKGASHFRSAGLNLKWYQRVMTDIFLSIILCVITLLFILYQIGKISISFIREKQHKHQMIDRTNKFKKQK